MVECAGNISSVLGVVLQVGKWLAAPLGRQFMYLYNYNTNFDSLQEEVDRLKDAKERVERKVDAAERNVEEIEGNVKKWQNNVEKTIVQAERLIRDKSNNPRCFKGLRANCITSYKYSKKAFKLKRDDIGPLLLQEEKFDSVSYPTIPPEKNFDKLGDDVLKLKNAKLKVQRKVEEAKINEEEIEEDVKKWLEDVDSIVVKAEELIKNQSSTGTHDRKTRYQNSKAASELMVDVIGPLLQQEERFDKVSYSTIQLFNYEKNFDKLRDDVSKLKNARLKVQRKVEEAKNNEEEIEEDVKKWLEDVDSIIVKAEELIRDQSSIGTDRKTRCQNSKAASELIVDDIGPLLQQEERFDKVSYSSIQLSNYEKNFDKLGDDVLKLKNARLKVQRKVEEAKKNVEEIEEDVKKWLEDVDSIIVKAGDLIANQSSIGTDRKTRHQNSKAASELTVDNIGPLLQQEEIFDKVSHPTIHKEIWLGYNEDYLAFESRNSTVNNIWDALQDGEIYMMGVYGMGGLGKTTLVQEIGRKAEKDKLFDEIAFVEVTETLDVEKIQTEIADKLGVKFNNQSERASKLCKRLRNSENKILLILDNVWEDLDLNTIGIPSKTDHGGCKIMLTTRKLDVLQKMNSTSNFGMGILEEEEAWQLFMKMAGSIIQAPELNSLPKDVCKECGGLPIVICTIAKALRKKDRLSAWKVVLQELKAPSPAKFIGLLEKEYVKIALSYKYLRNDELKKTFLISSLMKNNTSISNLFKQVVGLDILEGANLKMEDARDRLDELVCELKDSCLLLDGFTTGQFAMHDVIRAVAITIAYTDHHVFTERNDVEKEWKDKDKLKKCTKISLPHGSTIISQLWPKDLDCPNLEYFCTSNMWNTSFQIPKDFFTVMPKLKVLNLFETQQLSLPLSLNLLTNLQTLCLDQSKIEDVVIIGKLKKLKVLSLQHSYITELPTEIGQLTQLKILDLRYCWQLKCIAPNVISKLLQLEELYMTGCPIQWKVEIVEEFKHLTKVTTLLTLVIKDDIFLPQGFFSKDLKRYKISVGHWPLDPQEREFTRMLKFKFNSTISLEDLRRIKNVEFLWLAELLDVENGLYNFEMRPLFEEQVIFPDLKVLTLTNINYRKIWASQLSTSCCQNLTKLTLMSCGNIKYVFPSSIIKSLQQLQQLKIADCKVLEEIVTKQEGANAIVNFVFPNVTLLKLEDLPQLTDFCSDMHILELPILKQLVVINCDKFTSKYMIVQEKNEDEIHISGLDSLLRNYNEVIFRDLKFLALIDINDRKILDNQLRISSYQNWTKLTMMSCGNLKYVFPSSIASSFQQLQQLMIKDCQVLKEIVAKEEGANSQLPTSSFQNLTNLTLKRCKNTKYVFPSSIATSLQQLQRLKIEDCWDLEEIVANEEGANNQLPTSSFQNLTNLTLKRCENIKYVFPSSIATSLQQLQQLMIEDCGVLEEIVANKEGANNQLPTSSFQNLTNFTLKRCENIKYVFPSSIATSLQQLQQLKIEVCQVLEEIVAKEEGANAIVSFAFPNITILKLKDLPQLTTFYPRIHTLELPILKVLMVINCDKFSSKNLSFQENDKEGETHISKPKYLFLDNKINFDLQYMELQIQNKRIEWLSQFKALKIHRDKGANISLKLFQTFGNLKELRLSFCYQYKEIKCLSDLSNLEVLNVNNCNGLMMKLITPSTVRSLVQLRELSIEYCEMLIEIVENEGEGAATSTEIVFDNLKKLSLRGLESLICFCFGNYSFNFPSLEDLIIRDCPNMKTFSQGILSMPMLHKVEYDWKQKYLENGGIELNTIIQQAHKEKVDSNLKENLTLTLSGRDIVSIWEGEFQESFGKVKTLELINDEYANIPVQILHKFKSLQKLILKVSSYEEIFSFEEDKDHIGAFKKLKDLELRGLFNLKCIWKQDSLLNSILQNLARLEVKYCENLTTLLPSLASFENLTTLTLMYCNGMQNLMSSSTAKSLVRLKELNIERCEMMREVLANEEDIEKTEIVFEKLNWLWLDNLESFTCFYSGNYTLQFPNLKSLYVYNCSKMKTFSRGDLSMPKLQELNNKDCSESDIDTIIHQLQNGRIEQRLLRFLSRTLRFLNPSMNNFSRRLPSFLLLITLGKMSSFSSMEKQNRLLILCL